MRSSTCPRATAAILVLGCSLLTSAGPLYAQPFIPSEIFQGKVVGVTDGDTLAVLLDGKSVRIRLEGIDAPESGQDFGSRAKQALSEIVFGRVVDVFVKEFDFYGRRVARVHVDGIDVSMALVRAGWAWHFVRYSNDMTLAAAEQEARSDRVGLWQGPNPIPPWDARRPTRNATGAATPILYHGNRLTGVYHGPGCRDYDCPHCVMVFSTQRAALSAGFRPHADCVR